MKKPTMRIEDLGPDSDNESLDGQLQLHDTASSVEKKTPAMCAWLREYHDDKFDFNTDGRHVLHEMVEQWRKATSTYDEALFLEAVSLAIGGIGTIDVKTSARRPQATTAFSMLCRELLKASGCPKSKYIELIELMLAKVRM